MSLEWKTSAFQHFQFSNYFENGSIPLMNIDLWNFDRKNHVQNLNGFGAREMVPNRSYINLYIFLRFFLFFCFSKHQSLIRREWDAKCVGVNKEMSVCVL